MRTLTLFRPNMTSQLDHTTSAMVDSGSTCLDLSNEGSFARFQPCFKSLSFGPYEWPYDVIMTSRKSKWHQMDFGSVLHQHTKFQSCIILKTQTRVDNRLGSTKEGPCRSGCGDECEAPADPLLFLFLLLKALRALEGLARIISTLDSYAFPRLKLDDK